jgi:hypothetical protein
MAVAAVVVLITAPTTEIPAVLEAVAAETLVPELAALEILHQLALHRGTMAEMQLLMAMQVLAVAAVVLPQSGQPLLVL